MLKQPRSPGLDPGLHSLMGLYFIVELVHRRLAEQGKKRYCVWRLLSFELQLHCKWNVFWERPWHQIVAAFVRAENASTATLNSMGLVELRVNILKFC